MIDFLHFAPPLDLLAALIRSLDSPLLQVLSILVSGKGLKTGPIGLLSVSRDSLWILSKSFGMMGQLITVGGIDAMNRGSIAKQHSDQRK